MQVSGKSEVITPKNESQTILDSQTHKTKPESELSQRLIKTTPNCALLYSKAYERPEMWMPFFSEFHFFFR
jgi:hypothetical protein